MEIRRLQEGDEQLAIDAVASLIPEDERDGQKPSIRHMHVFLAHDENYLIVALDGALPIGFLVAYRMPKATCDASMVYLYEIAVTPTYRRQGVATRMINLLKALCKETDVVQIWVGTGNDNLPAKRLCESTGAICVYDSNAEFVYRRENLMA